MSVIGTDTYVYFFFRVESTREVDSVMLAVIYSYYCCRQKTAEVQNENEWVKRKNNRPDPLPPLYDSRKPASG